MSASILGEHSFGDTPAIVLDDWVITVPAGYIYSTDKEIVGHRPIVLGLDDGTLDLSSPLPLLSESECNPINTTTYGFGEMIADAVRQRCRVSGLIFF